MRRDPHDDSLHWEEVCKANDQGSNRGAEEEADDQTQRSETHRRQKEIAEGSGQIADPGAREPCRGGYVAGMGHYERRTSGNNR